MNRSFSSATQVSFHGIGKVSFADQKTCQASLRSILSDIYPVQTHPDPPPQGGRGFVRGRHISPSPSMGEGRGGGDWALGDAWRQAVAAMLIVRPSAPIAFSTIWRALRRS